MEITWLGTAGFQIKTENSWFLVDPFVSRNPQASPVQPKTPGDLEGDWIFLSHGHFDHIHDVPVIARTRKARVYGSDVAAGSLKRLGVPENQLERITRFPAPFFFDDFSATAFFSRHIRFDLKLLVKTLFKINVSFFKYLPLLLYYPCGQVLSWQFEVENQRIHFFGSAGATEKELKRLAQRSIDILILPLEGHTRICEKALKYVAILKPAVVIPCHHDEFFPPISQQVDITPFIEGAGHAHAATRVVVPKINQPLVMHPD